MGLLDDLLGGLAGQPMERAQQPAMQGGTGGMGGVMMALMPVVLGMLANRGSQRDQMGYVSGGGGGLGAILGQVLGGATAGGGAGGGLGGLLEQLQRSGYGEEASSWVGRGQNRPIPADAMTQIFGREGIEEISRRAGISEDEASRGLSELLPEVVDRVTPDGEIPELDSLTNNVDDLARRFGMPG